MADGGGQNDDQRAYVADADGEESGPLIDEAVAARRNPEREGKTEPQDFDVLLGRGRRNALHPGNRRFQAIIDVHQARFYSAASRHEKIQITQEIVNFIAQRGRFLKFDEERSGWAEVDGEVARSKVGHACRYRQRRQPTARSFPPPVLSEDEVTAGSQAIGRAMYQEEEIERGLASNNEQSPSDKPPSAAPLPHLEDWSREDDFDFLEHQPGQSPLLDPFISESASQTS